MRVLVITGSRADFGLLDWPTLMMRADPYFDVDVLNLWGSSYIESFDDTEKRLKDRPDLVLVLGDRYEILAAVTACHLARVPIAHIAGGDVTEGSYDGAMRDSISRMASIHFVTSTSAMARLSAYGYRNIHLVGSPGIDYIKHAPWKGERPYDKPYVVVSYQPETIDGTNEIEEVIHSLPLNKLQVFILPNPDRGSAQIAKTIKDYVHNKEFSYCHKGLPHAEFLNLIAHCDEFIGNSSAMLYEAPELGIKTRMVGKRQAGRTIPWGDGNASQRIIKILKYT